MKLLFTLIFLFCFNIGFAQSARTFYEEGMEKAYAGKLNEALALIDKSLGLDKSEPLVWFNRGVINSMLNNYEDALADYEKVLIISPNDPKAMVQRGFIKRNLTDYNGAMSDFDQAIKLDSNNADAYYQRGNVGKLLGKDELACADYKKAVAKGSKPAINKVADCGKPKPGNYYSILSLAKPADDKSYGYKENNPIKVGNGPDGGPGNQRAYLNLLRDAQGKSIKYFRVGSCCPYKSKYGFMDTAMLDIYEITFLNVKGVEEKVKVYISMYDYEELKIIDGFRTVGK